MNNDITYIYKIRYISHESWHSQIRFIIHLYHNSNHESHLWVCIHFQLNVQNPTIHPGLVQNTPEVRRIRFHVRRSKSHSRATSRLRVIPLDWGCRLRFWSTDMNNQCSRCTSNFIWCIASWDYMYNCSPHGVLIHPVLIWLQMWPFSLQQDPSWFALSSSI